MDLFGRDNLDTSNAFHVGDICYTEDNITVYNIYVYNLPKSINEDNLKEHFSRFGEVQSVSIVQRKKIKSAFRYAFVNFKKPESAAKAIRTPHHNIQGKRIKIKAADSWKQPTKQNNNENESTNNDGKNDKNDDNDEKIPPNSILNLNDDCLLHIFSFLTLREKLRMSFACERFQNIFEMIYKIEKQLNLNAVGHLTLMEVRQIVTKVGHLIERIKFSGQDFPSNHKRFIEFLPNFCLNLKSLELNAVNNIHTDTFRRIAKNLKSIQKLELINCDINDQTCLYISQLPNIKELNLSENYELTGKFLYKFENLHTLSLNNCANLQQMYFAELCEKLKLLKELNIKRCDRLNEESYNLMVNNLHNIEKLTISTNYQAEKLSQISKLNKLKSLTIYCTQLKDDLFINLSMKDEHTLENLQIFGGHLSDKKMKSIVSIKSLKDLRIPHDYELNDEFLIGCSKLKSLQYLDISGCTQITKSGILQLFKISNTIKTLDISSCIQFSNDLIYDIIDIIEKKRRNEPYTIIVGRTSILQSIIEENPKFIQLKGHLKLSFEFNVSCCQFSIFDDDDEDDNFMTDDDFDDLDDDTDDFLDDDDDDDEVDDYFFEMHVDDVDYDFLHHLLLFNSLRD